MVIFHTNLVLAAKDAPRVKGKILEKKTLNLDDVSDFDDVVEPANEHFGQEVLNNAPYMTYAYKPNGPPKTLSNFIFKSYPFPKPKNAQRSMHVSVNGEMCGGTVDNRFEKVERAHTNATAKLGKINADLAAANHTARRFAFNLVPKRLLRMRKYKALPKYEFKPFFGDGNGRLVGRRKRDGNVDNLIAMSKALLKKPSPFEDLHKKTSVKALTPLTGLKSAPTTLISLSPGTVTSTSTTTPLPLPKFGEDISFPKFESKTENPLAWEDAFLKGIYKNKLSRDERHEQPFEKNKRCSGNCKKPPAKRPKPLIRSSKDTVRRSDEDILKCLERHLNTSWCLLHRLYHTSSASPVDLTEEVNAKSKIVEETTVSGAFEEVTTQKDNSSSGLLVTMETSNTSQEFKAKSKIVEDVAVSATTEEDTIMKAIVTKANLTLVMTTEALNTSEEANSTDSSSVNITTLSDIPLCTNVPYSSANDSVTPISLPTNTTVLTDISANSTESGSTTSNDTASSPMIPSLNNSNNTELIKICAQMLRSKLPTPATTENPTNETSVEDSALLNKVTLSTTECNSESTANVTTSTVVAIADNTTATATSENTTAIAASENATAIATSENTTAITASENTTAIATSENATTTTSSQSSTTGAVAEITKRSPKKRASDGSAGVLVPAVRQLERDLFLIDELQNLLDSLKDVNRGEERVARKNSGKPTASKKKNTPSTTNPAATTTSNTSNTAAATTTATTVTEFCYPNGISATPSISSDNSIKNPDAVKLKEFVGNSSQTAVNTSMGANLHYPSVDLKTNQVFEDPVKGSQGNQGCQGCQKAGVNEEPPMEVNQINNVLQSIHDIFGGTLVHLKERVREETDNRLRRNYDLLDIEKETGSQVADKNPMVKTKRFLFKKKKRKNQRKKIWKKLHGRELQPQPFLGKTRQNYLSNRQNV